MATPTREGGEMPLADAVQEIEQLEGLDAALEARTSGLTWMVWGIVVAAIFVTYSYVGVVHDAYASEASRLFPVLWAPWVAMGVGLTALLWRSAGLVLPIETRGSARETIVPLGLFLGLIFGGLWLTSTLDVQMLEPATVLLAVGAATAGLGLAGVTTTSRFERRAAVIAGVFLTLVAIVSAHLLPAGGTGYAWLSLLAPLASVVAYFGVGALVYARG